jgi:hypothetical protein
VRREKSFFRGSELSRLLVLVGVLIVGVGLAIVFARSRTSPEEPPLVVHGQPEPIVPDRSIEFESVTDKTAMSFRDNAAYKLLLDRARKLTPEQLAGASRRDVLLTHLWPRPDAYRGIPIHIEGTAEKVLRYDSKLSPTGWLYEAWIILPDVPRVPYCCVFEDAPEGFPIGSNVAERVVFNGYFLKFMKYETTTAKFRYAPVLVGRIGWRSHAESGSVGMGSTLWWSLAILAGMIVISLIRWVVQLTHFARPRSSALAGDRGTAPADVIDHEALDDWVRSVSQGDDEPAETGDSSTPAHDASQSTSSTAPGD